MHTIFNVLHVSARVESDREIPGLEHTDVRATMCSTTELDLVTSITFKPDDGRFCDLELILCLYFLLATLTKV